MPDKPSYLGLLNAIAVAETRAHRYLTCWIEATHDPEVKEVLRTVAWREGEHGISFAKRINELGFEVQEKDDPNFARQLKIAASNKTDLEKMEKLGLQRLGDKGGVLDLFDNVFSDHTIDIRTGELLGRYIAEEFDSACRLRCCWEQLKSRSGKSAGQTADPGDGSGAVQLAELNGKVDMLCRAVEELRQIVCAQSMPADAG